MRLCALYNNKSLQFVYLSATISNPREHFSELVPLHVFGGPERLTLISADSAPRGDRRFILWNPIMKRHIGDALCATDKEQDMGVTNKVEAPTKSRKRARDSGSVVLPISDTSDSSGSTLSEAARVFASLVKLKIRTICFCRTRKLTELVIRLCSNDLRKTSPMLAPLVKSYRGGYTREDRRSIEKEMFSGKLLGIA